MNIRHTLASFAVVGAVWLGIAATEYSYDPNDRNTYIASVPHGETNEITSEAVSVLNGNGVTNFVKLGEGTLISNKDITSYTGGIAIAEGVFRSEPSLEANETVGKLAGGGDIHVSDGATLEVHATGSYRSSMRTKTVFVSGRGFNGMGALVACAGSKDGMSFGDRIVLNGDTLVCNNGAPQFRLIKNGGTLDFNGKTLYIGGSGEVQFYCTPALKNMPNPGQAIVSGGAGVRFIRENSIGGNYNLWEHYCDLVITNSSRLVLDANYVNNFSWPIKLHEGTGIFALVPEGTAWSLSSGINLISLTGNISGNPNAKVHLLDPSRNWIRFNDANDFLTIKGKMSGGGIFVSSGASKISSSLYLGYEKNDFTNGAVVTGCSLHLLVNGALPAAGAPLSLTNSAVVLHSTTEYSLPPLEVYGNCIVSNYNYTDVAPVGTWRDSVKKTGSGTLQYRSLIGAPLLDVRGGTVEFNPVDGALPVFNAIGGISSGTVDFGGFDYAVESASGSPNVVNCPMLTVSTGWVFDASTPVDSEGLSTDGVLAFADGCVLNVHNADLHAAGSRRRSWVIANAAGGIAGVPECVCDVPGWSVEKSADAKTLLLHSPAVGFRMILR